MNKKLFLHVGYPKTGTSFLQKDLFPKIDEVYFVGLDELYDSNFLNVLENDMTMRSTKSISDSLELLFEKSADKPLFISYEAFLGNVFNGLKDLPLIISRLKGLPIEIKILITIRDQVAIINSLYTQYVHQGGSLTFNNLLNLAPKNPIHLSLNIFDYYVIHSIFCENFKKENIFVIPYEFINQKNIFEKMLSQFFETKIILPVVSRSVNKSLSTINLNLLRFCNRFLGSWASSNGIVPSNLLSSSQMRFFLQKRSNRGKKVNYFKNSDKCCEMISTYEDSNKLLSSKIGIDLKNELNYL